MFISEIGSIFGGLYITCWYSEGMKRKQLQNVTSGERIFKKS